MTAMRMAQKGQEAWVRPKTSNNVSRTGFGELGAVGFLTTTGQYINQPSIESATHVDFQHDHRFVSPEERRPESYNDRVANLSPFSSSSPGVISTSPHYTKKLSPPIPPPLSQPTVESNGNVAMPHGLTVQVCLFSELPF